MPPPPTPFTRTCSCCDLPEWSWWACDCCYSCASIWSAAPHGGGPSPSARRPACQSTSVRHNFCFFCSEGRDVVSGDRGKVGHTSRTSLLTLNTWSCLQEAGRGEVAWGRRDPSPPSAPCPQRYGKRRALNEGKNIWSPPEQEPRHLKTRGARGGLGNRK